MTVINAKLMEHEEVEVIQLRTLFTEHSLLFLRPLQIGDKFTSPSVYIVKAMGAKNNSGKIRVLDPEYLDDASSHALIYEELNAFEPLASFNTRHTMELVHMRQHADGILSLQYAGTGLAIFIQKA